MPQAFACLIHDCPHAGDAFAETHENRLANEVVADVELDDLGNRDDGSDIIIVEPMACMDLKPCLGAQLRPLDKPGKLTAEGWRIAFRRGSAISAGVKLDRIGPDLGRCFDLLALRIDEQRNGVSVFTWEATSSPPSVVISRRRSGTRQQA
jgi:hypothetical protein